LLLDEYGSMDAVNDYIKKVLDETIEDYIFSETLKHTLKKAEVVSISSLMALISRVSEKELQNDEILFAYFQKFREDYRIENREELEELSQIKKLESIIQDSIKNEKLKILIQGIKQRIIASLSKKIQDIESEIRSINLKEKLNSLEEIEKSRNSLKRFKESEYENIILPLLGESERKVRDKIDKELGEIRFWLIEEKDEVNFMIQTNNESKKEMVKNFTNLMYQFNSEFKGKISLLIKSFIKEYNEEIREVIRKIFNTLNNSEFAKEFDLDSTVLEKIKDNLLKASLYDLNKNLDKLNIINLPKVNTGWFGDSKEKIKESLKEWLNNTYFSNAERILDTYRVQLLEPIKRAFDKKEERGVIIREFNKAVIEPIDKTLQRRENELKELKNDIKTDKQMLNKLQSQLQALNQAKEKIEKELR